MSESSWQPGDYELIVLGLWGNSFVSSINPKPPQRHQFITWWMRVYFFQCNFYVPQKRQTVVSNFRKVVALFVRRPVRESHFWGMTRKGGWAKEVPSFPSGSTSPFSSGGHVLHSPQTKWWGDVAPTVSLHCFLFHSCLWTPFPTKSQRSCFYLSEENVFNITFGPNAKNVHWNETKRGNFKCDQRKNLTVTLHVGSS